MNACGCSIFFKRDSISGRVTISALAVLWDHAIPFAQPAYSHASSAVVGSAGIVWFNHYMTGSCLFLFIYFYTMVWVQLRKRLERLSLSYWAGRRSCA